MFGWFSDKKEVKRVEEDTKAGFEAVKKDISSVSGWIKHLDSERKIHQNDIDEIKETLSTVLEEIEGLKNIVSITSDLKASKKIQTPKQVFDKQTGVYAVQTGVQTGVATPKLDSFSVTERAILWVLLNSDMKLSYDDLGAMLGKDRSTIRGQVNRIKQKSEGLLEEVIESNGKKRLFIPEEIKEKMLKKSKVSLKIGKKGKKKAKNSEK